MMGEEHMLCLDCHGLFDVSIPKRIGPERLETVERKPKARSNHGAEGTTRVAARATGARTTNIAFIGTVQGLFPRGSLAGDQVRVIVTLDTRQIAH